MGSLGELTLNDNQTSTNEARVNENFRESAVLHRSLHHEPLRAISSQGNYLYLNNGQKVFDATGGAAVACLGSGNERYDCFPCVVFDGILTVSKSRQSPDGSDDERSIVLPFSILCYRLSRAAGVALDRLDQRRDV